MTSAHQLRALVPDHEPVEVRDCRRDGLDQPVRPASPAPVTGGLACLRSRKFEDLFHVLATSLLIVSKNLGQVVKGWRGWSVLQEVGQPVRQDCYVLNAAVQAPASVRCKEIVTE